jgi:hypothetical protein
LIALDPAAGDPDGLASLAREAIARQRAADEAAAKRRQQVAELQRRIRQHADARDWDRSAVP